MAAPWRAPIRPGTWFAGLSLALVVGVLLYGRPGLRGGQEGFLRGGVVHEGVQVGERAPDFTLTDLGGSAVALSSFRGQPVVVNIWATWCGPCREEMPQIGVFYRRHEERVAVLGVAVMDRAEAVESFVREGGYPWRFLLDPTGAVASRYQVRGIPTTLFLDREGTIRVRVTGPLTAERLEAFFDMVAGGADRSGRGAGGTDALHEDR